MNSERTTAAAFATSIAAGIALAVVYIRGGQPQLEGVFLFVALGGIGFGLIVWAKHLFPHEEVVQARPEFGSSPEARADFDATFTRGESEVGRRRLLALMLTGSFAALAFALAFPVRSLGPGPGDALRRTSWRRGKRLVSTDTGRAVKLGDLAVGSVVTVFPEGAEQAEDSAALLIRVPSDRLRLPRGRGSWAPEGHVVYSKICTHVGCPVGLYLEQDQTLLCPCHLSTFAVLEGAKPRLGPATRALPQLPIAVDAEGYFYALGDFSDPVGPAWWNYPR
jgi:ubiquinol-cytochrome c reductase iron-sulfur subunit